MRWMIVLMGCLVVLGCGRSPEAATIPEDVPVERRLAANTFLFSSSFADRNAGNVETLNAAGAMISVMLRTMGYEPEQERFKLADGSSVFNVYVEVPGTGEGVVVVGAHYDAAEGTPGADDNASGVAGVLELARRFAETDQQHERTLRLVFFTTEEPPHYRMDTMGSLVHARAARERGDDIVAMVAVEMIGYFDDSPGSQSYPAMPGVESAAGLPDVGDFIGVVTRDTDAALLERVAVAMEADGGVSVVSMALPESVSGVGWSDHWSFWQAGFPAVMVTDTAFARNPHYHQPTDVAQTLDFARMELVVDGVERAVVGLLE